jgi:hypothetical protein
MDTCEFLHERSGNRISLHGSGRDRQHGGRYLAKTGGEATG